MIVSLVSTLEIKNFLNSKREAIEGRTDSNESYFTDIRRASEYAIHAISHQLETGMKWKDKGYVRSRLDVMFGKFKRLNDREAVNTDIGESVAVA